MIYRLMPGRYKKGIKRMLQNSGSKRTPAGFTNSSFFLSLVAGLALGYFSGAFAMVFAAVFVGMFVLFHGFLVLAIEKRAKFVETVLPDALQLMAANTRAGHIPSRALMLSARKEFGPLSQAIKKAGKEMLTGKSMEESFMVIPKYIKSEILEKSIKLIIRGAKSGGEFAELLEQDAENIRRNQAITKEVRANVTMYIIFIGFAGCVGAPILYALSSFLTTTITKLGAAATLPETVSSQVSFLQFSGVEISQEFLFIFSIVAIFVTTFFSGLIIGSISSGSEKAGIKFVPFLMVAAFGIFFLTRIFIETSFGAMIP